MKKQVKQEQSQSDGLLKTVLLVGGLIAASAALSSMQKICFREAERKLVDLFSNK